MKRILIFLKLFYKKLLWVPPLLLLFLFIIDQRYQQSMIAVIISYIFVQQFKLFKDFSEVINLCRLYHKSVIWLSVYNSLFTFILLFIFKSFIPVEYIVACLLPGFLFNLIKSIFHAH